MAAIIACIQKNVHVQLIIKCSNMSFFVSTEYQYNTHVHVLKYPVNLFLECNIPCNQKMPMCCLFLNVHICLFVSAFISIQYPSAFISIQYPRACSEIPSQLISQSIIFHAIVDLPKPHSFYLLTSCPHLLGFYFSSYIYVNYSSLVPRTNIKIIYDRKMFHMT